MATTCTGECITKWTACLIGAGGDIVKKEKCTADRINCIAACNAPPGGGVPPGTNCEAQCEARGFTVGTPDFIRCVEACKNPQTKTCQAQAGTPCGPKDPPANCGLGGECGPDKKCRCGLAIECSPTKPCTAPGTVCENGRCIDKGEKCVPCAPCSGSPTNNPACGGKWCRGGKCECSPSVCQEGACCQDTTSCAGKPCVNGKCQCTGETSCPEGKGQITFAGCPCNAIYNTKTGTCADGYTFVKRPNNGVRDDWAKEIAPTPGAVGTCECKAWITPGGGEDKTNPMGEYKTPPEMQALMQLLLGKATSFLNRPEGFTQEAIDAMFGRNFEKVRQQQAGDKAALNQGLSRQGMLGTGTQTSALNELSWMNEGNISNIMRDLLVANEEKKKQDALDYAQIANMLFGTGLGYETMVENINSARRGEGAQIWQWLMQWLLAQQGAAAG